MSAVLLYTGTALLLGWSFCKNRRKTQQALQKSWKAFETLLPQFLSLLLLIGFILALIDTAMVSRLIGKESGLTGMIIAAVIGSLTLIPGFIAFPLAASLLAAGAGNGQIAMFLTTLMMVGVVTLPLEITYFGKRLAIERNVLAFVYASISSFILEALL